MRSNPIRFSRNLSKGKRFYTFQQGIDIDKSVPLSQGKLSAIRAQNCFIPSFAFLFEGWKDYG